MRRLQRALAPFLASLAVCVAGSLACSAFAKEAAPEAADPVLEARMVRITSELRCLVCQNQTVADSHADLAVDLRRQTRELLLAGKTDREVVDYMTARYGDFVLYRPPVRATTLALWFGPALMLLVGAGALLVVLKRRSKLPDDRFEPDADELGDVASPPVRAA